jgi:hypothetical protein
MLRVYRDLQINEFLIAAGDCSQGGSDYNACQFYSKNFMDVPLVYHSKGVAAQMTTEVFPILEKICDLTGVPPLVCFERNNGGASEMERLAAMNRLAKYSLYVKKLPGQVTPEESNKYGWDTTSLSRGDMFGDLKQAIDNRIVNLYDKPTVDELFSIVSVYRAGKWQGEAEKGGHDDLTIALAIAIQVSQSALPPQSVNRKPPGWYNQSQSYNSPPMGWK